MEENKRIVEIDGVKLEVDLRTAKKIDVMRVGDNVKVLKKEYDGYKVLSGIIVDFVTFNSLPTITVAVFNEASWNGAPSISFIHYNSAVEKGMYEISPCSVDEILVTRDGVLEKFEREIQKKYNEYEDLKNQKEYFIKHFMKSVHEIERGNGDV